MERILIGRIPPRSRLAAGVAPRWVAPFRSSAAFLFLITSASAQEPTFQQAPPPPASMWRQPVLSSASKGYLPPAKYDHPYTGMLITMVVDSKKQLHDLCRDVVLADDALGCGNLWPGLDMCAIVVLSDELVRAAGHEPHVVLRHEIGHCSPTENEHATGLSVCGPRPTPNLCRQSRVSRVTSMTSF
jgi:hypothetical protein